MVMGSIQNGMVYVYLIKEDEIDKVPVDRCVDCVEINSRIEGCCSCFGTFVIYSKLKCLLNETLQSKL